MRILLVEDEHKILLPEMDGLTACLELRQRGYCTPILMLTARDIVDDCV